MQSRATGCLQPVARRTQRLRLAIRRDRCMLEGMTTAPVLDREEYVEQAYFFRTFRERSPTTCRRRTSSTRVHEELLTSTRLPYAVQFLAAELKHTGLARHGFAKLPHYFTAFQAFVVAAGRGGEDAVPDGRPRSWCSNARPRTAPRQPTQAGAVRLPVRDDRPQPARLPRRLRRDDGRPVLRRRLAGIHRRTGRGRSATSTSPTSSTCGRSCTCIEQRRANPAFEPPLPPLFGEKEGKIAKASRGRDPLYLFAALQRQLGYPEVPRYKQRDDATTQAGSRSRRSCANWRRG